MVGSTSGQHNNQNNNNGDHDNSINQSGRDGGRGGAGISYSYITWIIYFNLEEITAAKDFMAYVMLLLIGIYQFVNHIIILWLYLLSKNLVKSRSCKI